jgi:UDP-2,3-diacylglucosamine hydrolase
MIYFISDVHLGHLRASENTVIEDRLITFLRKIRNKCECLIIVGDLFDYWFEYKTVIPKQFIRTISELYNLKQAGTIIEYIMGNHDFGHQSFFTDYLDIKVYTDDITREFNGKKFYLSHGDGKAYNDRGYLILKKILRNQIAQKAVYIPAQKFMAARMVYAILLG